MRKFVDAQRAPLQPLDSRRRENKARFCAGYRLPSVVVTIRTYLNLAQAELAKSLLDDYEICCAVAHENAHLYGGAPFAMPIGLLVDEDQAEQALRILDGDAEPAVDLEATPTPTITSSPWGSETPDEMAKNNPWELLAAAALFLFPGICVLQIKYPAVTPSTVRQSWVVSRLWALHFFGWLAVAFAASLIATYFYLRRSSFAKPNPQI
jgi:hypothetical protein